MTTDEKIKMAERWRQQHLQSSGCFTPVMCVILLAIILLFSSCATKTKIEYRDVVVDHYITNTVHDTLVDITTDSVYFEVLVKGDTVFQTKYKEKIRWRDKIVERHDTCWRDSVTTINKEIVREVTKIPKILKIFTVFSILAIIFAFIKLYKWLRIH